MDHVKQFQQACLEMKKDGTLTQERMTVAWLMLMPKGKDFDNEVKKLSSLRKGARPSHSG